MTATEARDLSLLNLRDTDSIRITIKSMAESGNMYATISKCEIREPELSKAVLEADGFKIDITDRHFAITW